MTIALAIAIIAVTLTIGSLLYVWSWRHSPPGGRPNGPPTNVYTATAGAMALLMAFTMSLTYAQYLRAQEAAQQEAGSVMSLSRAATFMAPNVRDQLRNELVCYAQTVINIEWPSMREGNSTPTPELVKTIDAMDAILIANRESASSGLTAWETANDQRWTAHLARLDVAGDSVPLILWLLLTVGSLITIGSLFLYAGPGKPGWGHVLVIIGPMFVVSAALVVIAFFDHPYVDTSGGIKPTAMETTLYNLSNDHIGDLPLPSCPTKS
jgi:hypothetical protein